MTRNARKKKRLVFFSLFVTIQTHIKLYPGTQVYLGLETPQGRHLLVRGGVLLFLGVLRPRVTSGATCYVNNKKRKVCFLKSLFLLLRASRGFSLAAGWAARKRCCVVKTPGLEPVTLQERDAHSDLKINAQVAANIQRLASL